MKIIDFSKTGLFFFLAATFLFSGCGGIFDREIRLNNRLEGTWEVTQFLVAENISGVGVSQEDLVDNYDIIEITFSHTESQTSRPSGKMEIRYVKGAIETIEVVTYSVDGERLVLFDLDSTVFDNNGDQQKDFAFFIDKKELEMSFPEALFGGGTGFDAGWTEFYILAKKI